MLLSMMRAGLLASACGSDQTGVNESDGKKRFPVNAGFSEKGGGQLIEDLELTETPGHKNSTDFPGT